MQTLLELYDVMDAGTSLHINYKLGNQTLTSVTAYRYDGNHNNNALDFVPSPLFLPINVQDLQTHKFSEELRLASPTGDSSNMWPACSTTT